MREKNGGTKKTNRKNPAQLDNSSLARKAALLNSDVELGLLGGDAHPHRLLVTLCIN